MEFIGDITLTDVIDQKVGIVLKSDGRSSEVDTISGVIFMMEGKPYIDCIPMLDKKHVAPLPEGALIAEAKESAAPWPYAVFISRESEAGLLIIDLLRRNIPFGN